MNRFIENERIIVEFMGTDSFAKDVLERYLLDENETENIRFIYHKKWQ